MFKLLVTKQQRIKFCNIKIKKKEILNNAYLKIKLIKTFLHKI